MLALAADWSAVGGATTTLTPAGFGLDAHETDGVVDQVATGNNYSCRGGHWDAVGAGTVSYGVSVPTSATYNLVVCELKGSASTNATVTTAVFAAPVALPAATVTAVTNATVTAAVLAAPAVFPAGAVAAFSPPAVPAVL